MGSFASNRAISARPSTRMIIHAYQNILVGLNDPGNYINRPWPVANLAMYFPFTVQEDKTFKRILVRIASISSGNLDVGVYDAAGSRKVSIGTTAVAAANTSQILDITDTQLIAGDYYLAMACDNTTVDFPSYSLPSQPNMLYGIKEETSAFVLPATATFAEDDDRSYIPLITLTSES